jgi:phage FluMu gp28-like protein
LRKEYKEAEENGDNERVNQLSKPLIELEKLWNYSHLTKQFDSNTNAKEYYCNRLLDLQIALLTTNDKNMLQLQGSIDVDKNMFSEVADEIRFKHGAQKPMPFDHTALRTAVRAKR